MTKFKDLKAGDYIVTFDSQKIKLERHAIHAVSMINGITAFIGCHNRWIVSFDDRNDNKDMSVFEEDGVLYFSDCSEISSFLKNEVHRHREIISHLIELLNSSILNEDI